MNTAPPPIASAARVTATTRPDFAPFFIRSLNDNRSDHARMNRAGEMIRTRLVELVRKTLVRIHTARLKYSRVADHGVRFIIHVGPDHSRAGFDRQRRGMEREILDDDLRCVWAFRNRG